MKHEPIILNHLAVIALPVLIVFNEWFISHSTLSAWMSGACFCLSVWLSQTASRNRASVQNIQFIQAVTRDPTIPPNARRWLVLEASGIMTMLLSVAYIALAVILLWFWYLGRPAAEAVTHLLQIGNIWQCA